MTTKGPFCWLTAALLTGALPAGPALAGELRPVEPREIVASASSERDADAPAAALVDGRLGRPWISARGEANPSVTLRFPTTRYVTALRVLPGHGADNGAFKQHARPARVRVTWDGGEASFALEDRRVAQDVPLGRLARASALTLTVEAIHGSARQGVALSEIQVFEPDDVLQAAPELRREIDADVEALAGANHEAAARRLQSHGAPAVPALVDAVARDSGPRARAALGVLLGFEGPTGSVVLRDQLLAKDPARLSLALDVMEARATNDALAPALAEAARQAPPEHAVRATAQLCRTTPSPAAALRLLEAAAPGSAALGAPCLGAAAGEAGLKAALRLAALGTVEARLAAARALGGHAADPRALEALIALTERADQATRLTALDGLARATAPEATARLAHIARSVDAPTREAAVTALLSHGQAAVPHVRSVLDAEDPIAARALFRAMGDHADPRWRDLLVASVLRTPRGAWYEDAAFALTRRDNAGAAALLDGLARAPGDTYAATEALALIAPRVARLAAARLLDLPPARSHDTLREALLDVVRRAGDATTAPLVVAAYERAPSLRLRLRVVETLGHLNHPAALDFLERALVGEDRRLVTAALVARARLGDARLTPQLLAELRGQRPEAWSVRTIEALGLLRAGEAVDVFRAGFDLATGSAKLAILKACERMGTADAIALLTEAAVSREPMVSRAAGRLLVASRAPDAE